MSFSTTLAMLVLCLGQSCVKACDEFVAGTGAAYRGCQTKTKHGHKCLPWTDPVAAKFHNSPAEKPDAALEKNYCRNPDGNGEIWCYAVGGQDGVAPSDDESVIAEWEPCAPLPTVECPTSDTEPLKEDCKCQAESTSNLCASGKYCMTDNVCADAGKEMGMDLVTGVMLAVVVLSKAAVGIWIWSVWSWRMRRETSFRAEGAKNIVEEFQKYGYPIWVLKLTGIAKFSFSGLLIVSLLVDQPLLTLAGSLGMIFLMVVAVGSHIKVKDGLTNNTAALIMLVFSVIILIAHFAKPSCENVNLVTQIIGGVCSIACLGMFGRSFMNGDYNLDNYTTADPDGAYSNSKGAPLLA